MPTGGGEHAPPGSLLMALPTDANRPFPSTPPVYPRLRCGLNLYGTRRFYLSGTRRFYLSSPAEYRSPNSPLLIPPLLRLGSVGVLTSVPVALVIKRAGYTREFGYLSMDGPSLRAARANAHQSSNRIKPLGGGMVQ